MAISRTEPRSTGGSLDALPGIEEGETALVERAKVDPAAFGLLYDRYASPVYRYCFARLGTREAAEDATSQVFASALAALPRFRDRGGGESAGGSFRSWLFAIAHNTITDAQRRGGRTVPAAIPDRPDPSPSPEELAIAGEERRTMRALLAALPPDQRRALELRLAGLAGPEIARVLGRSHGSVKMLQLRAMTTLRRRLGPDAAPQESTR